MTAALGLGTYRVRAVEEPARAACSDGLVWLDTAPNYATAHQALGPVIADHPRAMIATKTGFFTQQEGEAAVAAGVLPPEEAAVGHSLHPASPAGRPIAPSRPWAAPTSCSSTTPSTPTRTVGCCTRGCATCSASWRSTPLKAASPDTEWPPGPASSTRHSPSPNSSAWPRGRRIG
ncbi:hypothetical protein WKI68_21720 [Streptomyces sp. MS1.HAVA.3]|uniref:NADP-dependent oxidoreductase domain-containing protein n=1 Tax=Streptomyces caledonius TaxID=3134107 RepID=A0ABU8U6J6_9ACTN